MHIARLTVGPRAPAIVAEPSWVVGRRSSRMAIPKVTNLEGQVKLSDRDIFTAKNEDVRRLEVLMDTCEILDQLLVCENAQRQQHTSWRLAFSGLCCGRP